MPTVGGDIPHGHNIPFALGQVWGLKVDNQIDIDTDSYEVRQAEDGALYVGGMDIEAFNITSTNANFLSNWIHLTNPESIALVGISGTYSTIIVHKIDPKYLPNDGQSDWNQNDETASDFVKNRTHYEIPEVATVLQLEDSDENVWRVYYNWKHNKPYTLRIDGVVYSFDSMTEGGYYSPAGQNVWYLGEKVMVGGASMKVLEWVDYPFSMFGIIPSMRDEKFLYIQFEDATPNHTIEVIEVEGKIHYLDPKYIKDMYYEEDVKQDISGMKFGPLEVNVDYAGEHGSTIPFERGQIWRVNHIGDSTSYNNIDLEVKQAKDGTLYIGDIDTRTPPYYISSRESKTNWSFNNLKQPGAYTITGVSGYITTETKIHHLDPKYIKDMYYEEDVESTIVNNASVTFEEAGPVFNPFPIEIIEGDIYTVTWDGTTYECTAYVVPGPNAPSIGNGFIAGVGGGGSDEPFFITVSASDVVLICPETGTHTISISTIHKNIKTIDPKYIKDMYYDNGTTVIELMPSQTINGFAPIEESFYGIETPFLLNLFVGITYTVNWDGTEYECICKNIPGTPLTYIGNSNYIDMQSGGDIPFAIGGVPGQYVFIQTESSEESHTISITEIKHDLKQIDKKYLPIMEDKVIFSNDAVVNDNVYFNEKKLVGEYFVIFDGVKETVTFVDNYDYSFAVGSSFAIETWNAENDEDGLRIECDDGEHSLIIKEISGVIKEEYLPNIQSDWNASEGETGYIKNRTHYDETVVLFSERFIKDDTGYFRCIFDTYEEAGQKFRNIIDNYEMVNIEINNNSIATLFSRFYDGYYNLCLDESREIEVLQNSIRGTSGNTIIFFPEVLGLSADVEYYDIRLTVGKIHHLDPKYIKDMYYDSIKYVRKTRDELSDIYKGVHYPYFEFGVPVEGVTFKVVADGIVYDNVPIRLVDIAGGDIWGIGDYYNVGPNNPWQTNEYGFCFSGHGLMSNKDFFPNGIQSIEVYAIEGDLKRIDPKYLPNNGQSDWNQNISSAPDYIKNRTHYEFQPGWTQINLIDDDWGSKATCKLSSTPIEWSKDNSYQVRVDGVEYEFDGMTLYTNLNIFGSNDLYYIGAEYVPYNPNIDFLQYPFCFVTLDFENIYAVFEDGTLNHTVEFFDSNVVVKQIDSKYLPIATDDDIMDMLAEISIIEPLATSDGSIYTNKNGDIYTL